MGVRSGWIRGRVELRSEPLDMYSLMSLTKCKKMKNKVNSLVNCMKWNILI